MIYFIAGASGSGKTSIIKDLKEALPKATVYDFDEIGVPEGATKAWRQEATEKWLQRYLKAKDSTDIFCICGQVVLGEILACPSADKIGLVNLCLLDIDDFERIRRLKLRNTYGADQDMLSWVAWLRMHHQDPQWCQHTTKEGAWKEMNFARWDNLKTWDTLANVKLIDTKGLSIPEVAMTVKSWIDKDRPSLKIK